MFLADVGVHHVTRDGFSVLLRLAVRAPVRHQLSSGPTRTESRRGPGADVLIRPAGAPTTAAELMSSDCRTLQTHGVTASPTTFPATCRAPHVSPSWPVLTTGPRSGGRGLASDPSMGSCDPAGLKYTVLTVLPRSPLLMRPARTSGPGVARADPCLRGPSRSKLAGRGGPDRTGPDRRLRACVTSWSGDGPMR